MSMIGTAEHFLGIFIVYANFLLQSSALFVNRVFF